MSVDERLLERLTGERLARRRRGHRKLHSVDGLLNVRVYMVGPKWRRHFGVQEVPIVDVDPIAARYHRPGRKLLMFTLEEDVRERVLEELRPGVAAEWTDPRELWKGSNGSRRREEHPTAYHRRRR